jgi:2-hydroxychromene-2-carboxylate isomerase
MSPAFYFDLASPLAYLAAERVLHVLPGPVEWRPVLARELPGAGSAREPGAKPACEPPGAESAREPPGAEPFAASARETEVAVLRAEVERRARELGLQPLRWPDPFPFDSALAMRVATYAKGIGRAVPFAQAAFRQAFAGGHDLERPDFVLIAAAACEMHPQAVLRGAELRTVRAQLTATTAEAARAGVADVPAVRIESTQPDGPDRVFLGERAPEDAAAHLAQAARGAADGETPNAGALAAPRGATGAGGR